MSASVVRTAAPAADVAEARWIVYRTLSALHLSPTEERLGTLVAAAPELLRRTEPLRETSAYARWSGLLGSLEGSDDAARELQSSYASLFLSGARERSVPPHESAYLDDGGAGAGWLVAGLTAEYAAAGFEPAGVEGVPPDHAAVELDLLGALCRREADAWPEDLAAADGLLGRELGFLQAHTLRWFPAFARHVAGHEPKGMYARIVGFAATFVEHDARLIQTLREAIADSRTSAVVVDPSRDGG